MIKNNSTLFLAIVAALSGLWVISSFPSIFGLALLLAGACGIGASLGMYYFVVKTKKEYSSEAEEELLLGVVMQEQKDQKILDCLSALRDKHKQLGKEENIQDVIRVLDFIYREMLIRSSRITSPEEKQRFEALSGKFCNMTNTPEKSELHKLLLEVLR